MHDYDVTLKLALQGTAGLVLHTLTGVHIERWLNIELPEFRNARVDLLGATSDDSLVHIELQSGNDSKMALRMAEYCLSVYRRLGRFPAQVLLYVGEAPLRMQAELTGADFSFRYKLVDIRELDGERLLESDQVGDNVIAILARLQDSRAAVRRVAETIALLSAEERGVPLRQLRTLAGLRHLEDVVEQEVRHMPITEDIRNHKVFRLEYAEAIQEGRQQGELTLLHRLIEKRFGPLPDSAAKRLAHLSTVEIEDLSLRLLDARSLSDLLP